MWRAHIISKDLSCSVRIGAFVCAMFDKVGNMCSELYFNMTIPAPDPEPISSRWDCTLIQISCRTA